MSSNKLFFGPYKELSLPRPRIDHEVVAIRGGFRISFATDKLARAVYVSAPKYAGSFTDNYFDLIPGRKVEVEFRAKSAIALTDFRNQLRVRSLTDAFE